MKVIGLTGLIGAGKSTASAMLKEKGLSVFDADATVHDMMENHAEMIAAFQKKLPFCVENNRISRAALAQKIAAKELDVTQLENIIYPFLEVVRDAFISARTTEKAVVLDVPLLFEAHWDAVCDIIITMVAPEDVLKQRVMSRPLMTAEKYAALRSRQTCAAEKTKKSTYVIDSSNGYDFVRHRLNDILEEI